MNFGNNLELTQSQKLIMTMQLKQSLIILNMSKLELEETISKESQENPLLDAEKPLDIDWESYIKDLDKSSYKTDRSEKNFNPDNNINLENLVKYSSNIYEHLLCK